MKIKDLIAKLEALYNIYDDEYKDLMGEPEIMIDLFKLSDNNPRKFYREYAGISRHIVISKSSDGVYDILSAFYEDQNQNQEATQYPCSAWPFPQGGKP